MARSPAPNPSIQTAHRTITSDSPPAEPSKKERKHRDHRNRSETCLNCGKTPLTSEYCPDCGQENTDMAVPISVLFEDVFEEFLKWDGRLLRTMVLLLSRPGRFTYEYTSGRRVRFVSPFKLYLGVTTVFFLILFLPQTMKDFRQRFDETRQTSLPKAATPKPKPTATPTPPSFSSPIRIKAGPIRRALKVADTSDDDKFQILGETDVFTPKDLRDGREIAKGHYLQEYDLWQQDSRNTHRHIGFKHVFIQQVFKCADDLDRFLRELVEAVVKSMFFLMPVYALILGALFRSPRKYYVEHLVFAVNHHTFSFFLAGLMVIAVEQKMLWMLWLLPFYYIYEFISLRVCYGQGKRLTLFKQFMLNQVYFVVLLVGFTITALVTVAFL